MAELNSFLTSIADAIRSKKGTTEPINASNFASEIESIESGSGGGGGSATVTVPGGLQGTVVPNTGHVENVYVNTNLSKEEVNTILDNISFNYGDTEFLISNEQRNKIMICLKAATYTGGEEQGYQMVYVGDNGPMPMFNSCTEDFAVEQFGVAFTGWHSDFNGVFEFNDTAVAEAGGKTIGSQNNKLSSLFSITPFVQVEAGIVELIGEYDGSPVVINNIEPGWQGTPVPNSGYVENVYFNTELSIEEVSNIVEKTLDFQNNRQKEYLLWNEDNIVTQMYIEYGLVNGIPDFTIQIYTPDGFSGMCYCGEECYDSELGGNFIGWNPRLSNPFPINLEVISGTYYGNKVGTKNKLLSSLFSLTPFEFKNEEEASTINLKEYIEEQKLPLKFKIDLPEAPNTLLELINNRQSCCYLYAFHQGAKLVPELNYDDTKNIYDFSYMYYECSSATSFPLIDTSNGESFMYMYSGCSSATSFPLIDTSNGDTFEYMYSGCSSASATSFPLIDTSNGYHFDYMYSGCSSASSFPLIDTSNGYTFTGMYASCSNALSFPELDTSNGSDFSYMYQACSDALSFPELDTSNGDNFEYMYSSCSMANSFPELDTSDGTIFYNMYSYCSNATIFPELNTSKGIEFSFMYRDCSRAPLFPKLDTSNGTNFRYMYAGCSSGQSFPELNTKNGTNFSYMYQACSNALSFPELDTSNGDNFEYMYSGCSMANSFPELDTSKGTIFHSMYRDCSSASSFPKINTSNGNIFYSMYQACSNALSFPELDTSKGTGFSSMYSICSSATSFPKINTDKATDVMRMYERCIKAKIIDISHYNISISNKSYEWCAYCYSLKAVIIRSFGENYVLDSTSFTNCYHMLGTVNEEYNQEGFKDGYIYAPRNMIETLQNSTNWSTLQFRALEDYTKDGTTTGELDLYKAMPEEYVETLTDKLFTDSDAETQTFSISLNEFTNIPSVNITSDNENVVISNVNTTESAITFDITRLVEECSANITVSVSGDISHLYSFVVRYVIYREPTYKVTGLFNYPYNFVLNSDGYYESNNKGVKDSYAMSKIAITNTNPDNMVKMTLECINYAESKRDYGIVSKLNKWLNQSYTPDDAQDNQNMATFFKYSNSPDIQEVSYILPTGTPYVTVKYIKNSSVNSYNDSLKFKVKFEVIK